MVIYLLHLIKSLLRLKLLNNQFPLKISFNNIWFIDKLVTSVRGKKKRKTFFIDSRCSLHLLNTFNKLSDTYKNKILTLESNFHIRTFSLTSTLVINSILAQIFQYQILQIFVNSLQCTYKSLIRNLCLKHSLP